MKLLRPLILASGSPRRAELLAQVGLSFDIQVGHSDEPPAQPWEDVLAWAQRAALDKARASVPLLSLAPAFILGADTVVVVPASPSPLMPLLHGNPVQVLGKPFDEEDACRILQMLSGQEHTVISAFALISHPEGTAITDVVEARVRFRELSDEEIREYVASGEPLDKAGAYGIQGRGAVLIDHICGDYYTIVGLPLARVWECLRAWRTDE